MAFLRAKHDLDTPTVRVIAQNRFILQGRIGAEKDTQRSGLTKGICRVGEQHHSVRNFIEGTFAAMHQIGPAFHCNRVKLVGQEGFDVIHSGRFLPVWIQEAVGFHRTDKETALFLTSMQNVRIGVPAVHQEVNPGLIRYGFDDIPGHIDLFPSVGRFAVEGIFGTGKTAYGLGRIMAHLQETAVCVIGVALLLLNLSKSLRAALALFWLATFLRVAECSLIMKFTT